MLKLVSYNCNSFRNNVHNIKNLLIGYDIVIIQELLMLREDLPFIDTIDSNFESISYVVDRSEEGILEGRPTNGVAILWRKALSNFIDPLICDDRVIGIVLNSGDRCFLILNVYMPCNKNNVDSLVKYHNYLGILNNVIEDANTNNIILMGDFNADPNKGRFYRELLNFCDRKKLIICDKDLDNKTFTYLCPATSTTSWLDHVMCSESVLPLIGDVKVLYDVGLYDHFPIAFHLDLDLCSVIENENKELINKYVLWNKLSHEDIALFKNDVDSKIIESNLLSENVFNCTIYNCSCENHIHVINHIYFNIIEILLESANKYNTQTKNKNTNYNIPGWNDYCKDLYNIAKRKFIIWRGNNCIKEDASHYEMKEARYNFREALKYCRNNEEYIRDNKLLNNIQNNNMSTFWRTVNKYKKLKSKEVTKMDGETNEQNIANIFANNFEEITGSAGNYTNEYISNKYIEKNDISGINVYGKINVNDVELAIKNLKDAVGTDGLHANHFKNSPPSMIFLLSKFFSSCLMHGYVPHTMMNGTIRPLIKNKTGNLNNSNNYRPIMNSSLILKMLEICLKRKIEPFVNLNMRQHGFKPNHSTMTAGYALKETVTEYNTGGSTVYCCFLDLSKAFDKVDHSLLIKKLYKSDIPSHYVNLIEYMYFNQQTNVMFNSKLSRSWRVGCGVRQGGILSPLLFNIYINHVIETISNIKVGCKLGTTSSNIIAYADDMVLMSPTRKGLQVLIDKMASELDILGLKVNSDKTVCMSFNKSNKDFSHLKLYFKGTLLRNVKEFNYLGIILMTNLCNKNDIIKCRNNFYKNFNSIIRKFPKADTFVKLQLFKSYCTSFYGSSLWYDIKGANDTFHQFSVGYHKAIKKIFAVSTHESNHEVCEWANLFTLKHQINYNLIAYVHKIYLFPNEFLRSIKQNFVNSCIVTKVQYMARNVYNIENICENDIDAIKSRIRYVQHGEERLR